MLDRHKKKFKLHVHPLVVNVGTLFETGEPQKVHPAVQSFADEYSKGMEHAGARRTSFEAWGIWGCKQEETGFGREEGQRNLERREYYAHCRGE